MTKTDEERWKRELCLPERLRMEDITFETVRDLGNGLSLGQATVRFIGTTPLVLHRLAVKSRRELKQLFGRDWRKYQYSPLITGRIPWAPPGAKGSCGTCGKWFF